MDYPERRASGEARLPEFDSEWNYSDPAATEARLREILAESEGLSDDSYRAQLLSQIARAQGLQRRFDEAHATLDCAARLVGDDMPIAQARCLLERGRLHNSAGRIADALPLFLEAWLLTRELRLDAYAVDAAHMIAIAESGEEALGWNLKALELAQSSSDPKAQRWRASLLNNIAWGYHERGEYHTALKHFRDALAVRRESDDSDGIRVAHWCVARCLRSLGAIEEALKIQRDLETEIARMQTPDGFVYEEIAECLLALGRTDDARPYFARAHSLLSADIWLVEREPQRLERMKALADAEDVIDRH